MFAEDDLLPISALQHLLFCERQVALIHVERLWAENRFTVEGRQLHEKADGGRADRRAAVRTGRGLLLRSFRLGLFGKADVVEFRPAAPDSAPPVAEGASSGPTLCPAGGRDGPRLGGCSPAAGDAPFPVEYKRGKPKTHRADEVQLCAQGLCLEEMLGRAVPAGALFYGKTRRRVDVPFDGPLRALTQDTAARLHDLIRAGRTPPAVLDARCAHCSLRSLCLPEAMAGRRTPSGGASGYLDRAFAGALAGPPAGD
jgi:CRISPR-associated exonuclease Cas4